MALLKLLNLKGLNMLEENPNDTVREEQYGADKNAAGSEETEKAEKTEKDEAGTSIKTKEEVKEPHADEVKEEDKLESSAPPANESAVAEEFPELDEIELLPVDYSDFTKSELVDTLALIIDNRPPSEIREDVERMRSLFYKKLRQESEERKAKFLEGGGSPKIIKYGSIRWITGSGNFLRNSGKKGMTIIRSRKLKNTRTLKRNMI